jgi:DNA-binding MarR family transcriptional regulator
MDYIALGKVKSSKYRDKIIRLLYRSPMTAKELAEQIGLELSNTSNYLATLQELGLIRCLNDTLRKGRMYALTEKGREIYSGLISDLPVEF